MEARLVFANLGFQNFVCVNLVKAVLPLTSTMTREMKKIAREKNKYINAASRKPVKTIVLLQTGEVVGVALYPATVAKRFRTATTEAYTNVTVSINEDAEDEKESSEANPAYMSDLDDEVTAKRWEIV